MASYTDPLEQATPAADDTIRHDPRQNHDDPLLDSLMIVCKLHNIISSRNVLTAGLPLKDNQLTLDTFPRAAQRAGLKARILQRPLEKISPLSLPAVVLLKNDQAAVLIGWDDQQRARLLATETEGGEILLEREELAENYSGKTIFIQPGHAFDSQPTATIPQTKSWFKDTLKLSKYLYLDSVVASFIINIIAIATPLFVMNVYDRVVPN